MYESNFGFHRQPFQCADLVRAFFVSESIRAILPQLLHALRSDLGIAVLTGPAGAGKSSLLKHLQSQLSQEGRSVICSGASLESPADVLLTLQTVSQQKSGEKLAAPSDGPSPPTRWAVIDQLRKSTEFWGPALLLIDDAQLLPVHILNELRAFTEEEWNGRGIVRVLVAGPHSFEEDLARPTHADFSRRIRCHAFLQPLTTKESIGFLSRHLQAAGGRLSDVFNAEALELITSACDGLPRCLSLLADESLLVATELSRKRVDEDCIRRALTRLQHLPYSWNASPIRPDENSFGADNEHSRTSSSAAATYSPVTTISAGVIEFGSPGVIEFGATAAGSVMTSPLVASGATVHADALESVVSSVADPGVAELGNSHDDNVSFEVGYCFTDQAQEPCEPDSGTAAYLEATTGSISDTDARSEIVIDGAEPEFSEGAPAHAPLVSEPCFNRFDIESLSDHSPVFDRYTWIAIGREVPPAELATTSTLRVQRTGDRLAGPGDRRVVVMTNPLCGGVSGSITVTRTCDQEIMTSLSAHSAEDQSGTLWMFHKSALSSRTIADDRAAMEELPRNECDARVDGGDAGPSAEVAWHDGQLVFSAAESEPEIPLPVDSTRVNAWTTLRTEQKSLDSEVPRVIDGDHESSEDIGNGSERESERFFTLPLNVNSIMWNRQPEHADFDSVLPLAESLASLRNEVTSFQQTGRTSFRNDSGTDALGSSPVSSPESMLAGGSLVARAKRQLDEMAISICESATDKRRAAASVMDRSAFVSSADGLNGATAGLTNPQPDFSRLFTRLRRMNRGTVENDF